MEAQLNHSNTTFASGPSTRLIGPLGAKLTSGGRQCAALPGEAPHARTAVGNRTARRGGSRHHYVSLASAGSQDLQPATAWLHRQSLLLCIQKPTVTKSTKAG